MLDGWKWALQKGNPGRFVIPLLGAGVVFMVLGWSVAVLVVVAITFSYNFGWRQGEHAGMSLVHRWHLEHAAETLGAIDESALAPDHPDRAALAQARAHVHAELERL